jgi:hypothetical protein
MIAVVTSHIFTKRRQLSESQGRVSVIAKGAGDGVVMMVLESLLAFVDEVKMTGQLETPREGLMNIAASFPSVMKPR